MLPKNTICAAVSMLPVSIGSMPVLFITPSTKPVSTYTTIAIAKKASTLHMPRRFAKH